MIRWINTSRQRLLVRRRLTGRRVGIALAAVAVLCGSTTVHAQTYPAKPITIVVPGAPGGATDAFGRALAQSMSASLGQTVIVENKAGASGMLAAQAVAQAAPDGYTLLLTHAAPIQNAPYMGKVPYDVRRDLAFIAQIGSAPLMVAVGKSVPAKDMKEFIAWAQKNKGKISYGSYGAGSGGHLISAFLNQSRQLDMAHAAYKGEAQLIQDLIGGHVPWGVLSMGSLAPHLASGNLRALAITSDSRSQEHPDVPTMAESGFPEPELRPVGWVGVLAPAAIPGPVLALVEKQVLASLQSPGMTKLLKSYAIEVTSLGAAKFRSEYEATDPIVGRMIEMSGAKQE
jgi:tripartite-type tricarboxylate transporter receptor subunit TctC